MFQTILVPSDGSPLSAQAAQAAIECARVIGASVVALSVAEPYPYSPYVECGAVPALPYFAETALAQAQACVQDIAVAAATAGVRCATHVAVSLSPCEEILRAAQQFHCDLIFMAARAQNAVQRFLLGSQTQLVLAHTTIPVLVFR